MPDRQTAFDFSATDCALAYLPTGSFEQHGPHLPFTTDTLIASAITAALYDAVPGLILPAVPALCSQEHAAWRGTVSVSPETAHAYVNNIAQSLLADGHRRVIIVNGHGGNYFLDNLAQTFNAHTPQVLIFPTGKAQKLAYAEAGLSTSPHTDMHAGEYETSLAMLLGFAGTTPLKERKPHDAPKRELLTLFGMRAYTDSGVIGHPELASADKGKRILESYRASFLRIWEEWDTYIQEHVPAPPPPQREQHR